MWRGGGTCACPGGRAMRLGSMGQKNRIPRGQAQGPRIRPTPLLVPTEPGQMVHSIAGFSR